MNRNVQRWKSIIRWALAVVLLLDVALLVVNWRASAADPRELQRQLQAVKRQRDLYAADVDRAKAIRQSMPAVQRQGNEFFSQELRQASTGYSSIAADLGAIAKEAGLQTSNMTFRQREILNRGVIEVEVAAVVEGDYPRVVRFINGLERSRNFYVLDNLMLASSTGGSLKLNLQLRTYFRS